MLFDYKREPTPGQILRSTVSNRRLLDVDGFGSKTPRFELDELNSTPPVGKYKLTADHTKGESTLLINSPSLSKKGYVYSFASKSPKLPTLYGDGVPGPGHYDALGSNSISKLADRDLRPSTAFIASGDGRVPFPKPNNNPGPAAYKINHDPGRSKIIQHKPSSTFTSKTQRDSIFKTPKWSLAPGEYLPISPPSHSSGKKKVERGDLQWAKSSYIRFQDLGKDNRVPGPQQYFNPSADEQLYSPDRTALRTAGNYRGKYVSKIHQSPPVLSTFGVEKDRFRNSTFGRLDLEAELPGPGAYIDDLNLLSDFSPTRSRSSSPNRSPLSKTQRKSMFEKSFGSRPGTSFSIGGNTLEQGNQVP